jgi:hypothetical protein
MIPSDFIVRFMAEPLIYQTAAILCCHITMVQVKCHGVNIKWHAFDLAFPPNIVWKYTSSRCLRGFDPSYPEETLFDFYLLSGGQLKYYPRASTARFSSEVFELAEPKRISALARASRMYPAAWLAAGGVSDLTSEQVIQEVESMIRLTSNLEMGTILKDALQKLKNLGPQF